MSHFQIRFMMEFSTSETHHSRITVAVQVEWNRVTEKRAMAGIMHPRQLAGAQTTPSCGVTRTCEKTAWPKLLVGGGMHFLTLVSVLMANTSSAAPSVRVVVRTCHTYIARHSATAHGYKCHWTGVCRWS